jgi:hypothetical protein
MPKRDLRSDKGIRDSVLDHAIATTFLGAIE